MWWQLVDIAVGVAKSAANVASPDARVCKPRAGVCSESRVSIATGMTEQPRALHALSNKLMASFEVSEKGRRVRQSTLLASGCCRGEPVSSEARDVDAVGDMVDEAAWRRGAGEKAGFEGRSGSAIAVRARLRGARRTVGVVVHLGERPVSAHHLEDNEEARRTRRPSRRTAGTQLGSDDTRPALPAMQVLSLLTLVIPRRRAPCSGRTPAASSVGRTRTRREARGPHWALHGLVQRA